MDHIYLLESLMKQIYFSIFFLACGVSQFMLLFI